LIFRCYRNKALSQNTSRSTDSVGSKATDKAAPLSPYAYSIDYELLIRRIVRRNVIMSLEPFQSNYLPEAVQLPALTFATTLERLSVIDSLLFLETAKPKHSLLRLLSLCYTLKQIQLPSSHTRKSSPNAWSIMFSAHMAHSQLTNLSKLEVQRDSFQHLSLSNTTANAVCPLSQPPEVAL
jgi:hypothetical protein